MQVFRDRGVISGFRYEAPLPGVPGISHCGEALCSRYHRVHIHKHDFFEFTYTVHGEAVWKTGNTVYRQRAGDLFFALPGQMHSTAELAHPEFHQFWVGIDVGRISGFGPALAKKLLGQRSQMITHAHEAEGLLRGIVMQVVKQEANCDVVVRAYVEAFLKVVEQRLLAKAHGGAAPSVTRYSYPVEKAMAFMGQDLTRRLSLGEMAHVAGAGVSKLSAAFRREVGMSPCAHHLRMRLDAARKALARSDATITQVSQEYGFSSSQHFSTAFCRAFQTPPRRWQARSRAGAC
ncbi:MAG: hypothetical protein C0404_08010 [Verrucomicrobia bacterium]|nr:hypothetical protein [Verrucomicrobiota bacterium]